MNLLETLGKVTISIFSPLARTCPWDVTLDDTKTKTTDHGTARSPNVPEVFSAVDDDYDTSAPDGYTRYTPDHSHRGEAIRQLVVIGLLQRIWK